MHVSSIVPDLDQEQLIRTRVDQPNVTIGLLLEVPGGIHLTELLHLTSLVSLYLTLAPNRGRRRKHDPETVRFFGNVHRGPVFVRRRRRESNWKEPRSPGAFLRVQRRPSPQPVCLLTTHLPLSNVDVDRRWRNLRCYRSKDLVSNRHSKSAASVT